MAQRARSAGHKRGPRTSASRSRSRSRTAPAHSREGAKDAIGLLKGDHREVEGLFARFENARGRDQKERLAQQICEALKAHAKIEEELFYPAAREAIDDEDLMNEAEIEHGSAKELIKKIEGSSADDDKYDALVTVLGEYIRHHVKEEEGEMFKKVGASDLDLAELGAKMKERKQELTGKAEQSRPKGRLASIFSSPSA